MPEPVFATDPRQRDITRELHALVRDLPLLCPHGHVDPGLLADDEPFPDPAHLLIVPDHYVTRMLLSQGIAPARLGVPTRPGAVSPFGGFSPAAGSAAGEAVETDGRAIWRLLADNWHLFRGTPSRLWLERTFTTVFGIETPLSSGTADDVYDAIAARLSEPAFRPRALFERFGIEVLATTESPLDDLSRHSKLEADGWGGPGGRVITTFRPDEVVDVEAPGWAAKLARLGEITGDDTATYDGYLAALRSRREAFIAAGATSSDHGHPTARTASLSHAEATELFNRAVFGEATATDAETFRAHMLLEFARMSLDDGLVMQLHPGAVRNHNTWLHETYGPDRGGDIPQATDYVNALRPLLEEHGNDPRLRLVVYTLDETAFSRELAPLAGGYPALYLGAPWWFLDTPDGLRRFRESVTDSAGFYNTAGFVDDTRAFCSIPVRHDVARRVDAAYLASLVVQDRLPFDEAAETIADLSYHLPKRIFRLDRTASPPEPGPHSRSGETTSSPTTHAEHPSGPNTRPSEQAVQTVGANAQSRIHVHGPTTPGAGTDSANTRRTNTDSANTDSANTRRTNTDSANTRRTNTDSANTRRTNTDSANTRRTNTDGANKDGVVGR